ncbi:hypothetical protein MBLNU457_g2695t1 [Dothideomycetes sp. NU457]
MAKFQSLFPWTKPPVFVNGPMGGFAGPSLATEVALRGGFGFIGSGFSMKQVEEHLDEAQSILKKQELSGRNDTLAVGIGFLLFHHKIEEVAPFIETYKPAAVWFFAAHDLNDYTTWAKEIRRICSQTTIWVQVGSVADAITVATNVEPDVLVAQGADAGGHGLEQGAGIISLVPEVATKLSTLGMKKKPLLLAAGGIADGRGVAAARALGAEGAVLGTRFLCAEEVTVPTLHREAVLKASDGGQSTVRGKVFDQLRGPNIWPTLYDGRSVVSESYTDWKSGVSIEQIQARHAEAVKCQMEGIERALKAGDIVVSVRRDTIDALDRVRQSLDL